MGHVQNLRRAGTRAKVVDDALLNRLGLQVLRTVVAHSAARLRRWRTDPDPTIASWVRELRRSGCLELPDFLAPEAFEAGPGGGPLSPGLGRRRERAARHAARRCVDGEVPRDRRNEGANVLEVIWRSDVPADRRADLDRFFLDPRLLRLASAAERLEVEPGGGRCFIHHLIQVAGEPDVQASLHTDIFYPTHKIWLYLDDVREEDGPLIYYPGSHRQSLASLRGVYRSSVQGDDGSRRVRPDEPARRKLQPKVFTSRANTVVIADTSGYHGRVQGRAGGRRTVVQIELRPDPFRRPANLPEDDSVSRATEAARASR